MEFNASPIPDFEQEIAATRKILERVPEDRFAWKPHEKSMELGRLASHIADLPGWITMTLNTESLELTPDLKPFRASTTAELLAQLDSKSGEARAAMAAAPPEALGVSWSLVVGGHKVMTMPRSAVLRAVVMNHLIHHRAQLGVFLRLLDVEIPGMYGPSADDAKFF